LSILNFDQFYGFLFRMDSPEIEFKNLASNAKIVFLKKLRKYIRSNNWD